MRLCRSTSAALVCVVLFGLAVAGCGSTTRDATQHSSTDPALPRAAFVARARAACDALDRALDAPPPTEKRLKALFDGADYFVSSLERFGDTLRSLVPPAADRAAFARYLRRVDTEIELARRLRAVLGRPGLVQTANAYGEQLVRTLTSPQPDMSRYGLGDCDSAA